MRAALLVLLLLPAGSPPDIVLPGHKDVRHELILLWDEACKDFRFVASPTQGFNSSQVIRQGEKFRFSGKYGTRIYAVPATAELPLEGTRVQDTTWPNSAAPVAEIASIAASHPLARVETTVRVRRVTADGIDFELVAERRFDAHGHELGDLDWLPLALLAAGGCLWIWSLGRRRSAPKAAAP